MTPFTYLAFGLETGVAALVALYAGVVEPVQAYWGRVFWRFVLGLSVVWFVILSIVANDASRGVL